MPTIRDVARAAGVAPSTVSYVLSGKKSYPQATVDRVMASVDALGYRPDSAARALALGRTNILGFLASVNYAAPQTDADVFMRFLRAALFSARQRGFDVLAMDKDVDALRGDILADALVVMDVLHDDPRLPLLRELGIPAVLIGVPPDSQGLSAYDLDFAAAAVDAVHLLAAHGHRRVDVLAPPDAPEGSELAYRRRYRDAFAAACLQTGVGGRFRPCGLAEAQVRSWLDEALSAGVTGIVVMGIGVLDFVLTELAARGIRVPAEMSLLALAPAEEFARSHPQLSLVDIPGRDMVARAVNRALDELAGAPAGHVELLRGELVDRGSVAAAPLR